MATTYRAAANFEATNENGDLRVKTWFFRNHNYCRIAWTPAKFNDELIGGPREINENWESLNQAGFEKIDAVLPIPGYTNPTRSYVFSGDKYVRITYLPGDTLVSKPRSIAEGWPSLGKLGFSQIDEVYTRLVVGDGWIITYFFSGTQYCQIKWKEAEAQDEILLLDGGKATQDIKDGWPGSAFERVDTIIPIPDETNRAYVFSGKDYALWHLGDAQPHKSNAGRSVADNWQSLKQAGFY